MGVIRGMIVIKAKSREEARKAVEKMGRLKGRAIVDSVRVVSKNYEVKYHISERKRRKK